MLIVEWTAGRDSCITQAGINYTPSRQFFGYGHSLGGYIENLGIKKEKHTMEPFVRVKLPPPRCSPLELYDEKQRERRTFTSSRVDSLAISFAVTFCAAFHMQLIFWGETSIHSHFHIPRREYMYDLPSSLSQEQEIGPLSTPKTRHIDQNTGVHSSLNLCASRHVLKG